MRERRTFGQILQAQKGSAGLHRSLVLLPDEGWALRANRGCATYDSRRQQAETKEDSRERVVDYLAQLGEWPVVNFLVDEGRTANRSPRVAAYAAISAVCFFLATVIFVLWQIA